jgi:hypothetical protein
MHPKVKRLAALAGLGALGVLAPISSASAATPPAAHFPLPSMAGLPAFSGMPTSFVGPSVGQVAAVIGPTVITTAPSTFNNTNIQVSAGGNLSGGQAGP